MNDKLITLNKKIKLILEKRDLPENIRKEIQKVYQEYRTFYEEYIKTDIHAKGEFGATRNIEEYFEANFIKSISDIDKRYKDRCEEIEEVATTVLQVEEIKILQEYLENDKSNYSYTKHIVDIVIDSISNSRNQMFRVLESLNTDKKRMDYIYEQIKLIENTAKLKLGNLKIELDIDNKQILEQIMDGYEQYKQENQPKETTTFEQQRKKFEERIDARDIVSEEKAMQAAEENTKEATKEKNNPLLEFERTSIVIGGLYGREIYI